MTNTTTTVTTAATAATAITTTARRAPAVAFSHLGFFVRDIARMEDFYTRVIGFTVTDRGGLGTVQLVFLSRDPEEHHQVVLASGRPDDLRFNLINQISFRVEGIAALRRFNDMLLEEERGGRVSELRPVTHGNAISIYFRCVRPSTSPIRTRKSCATARPSRAACRASCRARSGWPR